ncbi:hypothetical protein [Microaceticoccus formicicus]|uniref:hypothetical protein n=1 Tax=Microaceticoccus formicicus TaxID=3118105 RepID=UPI003CD01877|nr:hypothetical protein VZL98_10825 [Peptoniphilaceae bacterium AMB_02]
MFKDKKNVHIIITYLVSLLLLNASLLVFYAGISNYILVTLVLGYVVFIAFIQHYSRTGVWEGNIFRQSKYDLIVSPLMAFIIFASKQRILPRAIGIIVLNLYIFQLLIIKLLKNEEDEEENK